MLEHRRSATQPICHRAQDARATEIVYCRDLTVRIAFAGTGCSLLEVAFSGSRQVGWGFRVCVGHQFRITGRSVEGFSGVGV